MTVMRDQMFVMSVGLSLTLWIATVLIAVFASN